MRNINQGFQTMKMSQLAKVKLGSKPKMGDHMQLTSFTSVGELQLDFICNDLRLQRNSIIRAYLSSQLTIIDASSVSELTALTESSMN